MIDRRIFLKLSSGAAAGSAALAASALGAEGAAAGAEVALPPVQVGEGVRTALADPLCILSERLALASDGRLALQPDLTPAEAAGHADGPVLAGEGDFADREPLSLLLGGCPFNLGAAVHDVTTWLKGAGGQALWDMSAASSGWKPMMVGKVSRTDALVWSRVPLDLPRYFSGLRIAAPLAVHGPLRMLGAVPVSIGATELVSAFMSGAIDAFESDDPSVSREAASHLQDASWFSGSLAGTSRMISLRVPLAQWRALSSAGRAIMEAVAQETAATLQAVRRVHARLIVDRIARLRGDRPASLRSDMRRALSAEAVRLLTPMAARDPVLASALSSMAALVEPVFKSGGAGLS